MDHIAGLVGRDSCSIIGGFVPMCTTGQSVSSIGYSTIVLLIRIGIAWVASRRASA
jgi:hypothetical protein